MAPLRLEPLSELQWWQLHQSFLLEHPTLEPKPTLKQYEYEAVRVEFEMHEAEMKRVKRSFPGDDAQSKRARDDAIEALARQVATRRRHPAKFQWKHSDEEEREGEGRGEEDGGLFTQEQSAWILQQMDPFRATPLTTAQWRHLFKVFLTRFPKLRGVVSLAKYQTHASKIELQRDTEELVRVATTRPLTGGIAAQYKTQHRRIKATDTIKKEILLRDRPSNTRKTTTVRRRRTRLAMRDAELNAAVERVRSLETALKEAEEKVQRLAEAAAAAAVAEPPPRPQATAAPVAPVAVAHPRQSANGVTFVINLNLGDVVRAANI